MAADRQIAVTKELQDMSESAADHDFFWVYAVRAIVMALLSIAAAIDRTRRN